TNWTKIYSCSSSSNSDQNRLPTNRVHNVGLEIKEDPLDGGKIFSYRLKTNEEVNCGNRPAQLVAGQVLETSIIYHDVTSCESILDNRSKFPKKDKENLRNCFTPRR